jgi:O-antigen/teichoic acid export membrane protein
VDRTSARWLTRQFEGFDWSLIKGSSLLSIGSAIARVLGLAFSLVLAAAFSAKEYGEVRYALAVASIVAIGTMPFGQHVIARFVSKYRSEETKLNSILSGGYLILSLIFVATILIALPALLVLGKFNVGIMIVFLGETLFYAYWGLSSGFLKPGRLTVAYLSSNVIRILLVIILIQFLGIHSPTLALLIYGLSYLLPLGLLAIFRPLPGHVKLHLIDRAVIGELLRFSLPIWISHASYTLSLSVDLLLLEHMGSGGQLGAYSLSKTLASMFLIIPSGISTLLMPKVAATPQNEHRPLLIRMLIVSLLINGLALMFYLPLVRPLSQRIFGEDYLVPLGVSLLLSAYMILHGIHGLITAVLVGSGKPQVETMSRIAELIITALGCFLLVPRYGMLGAAVAMLAGIGSGLLTYVLVQLVGPNVGKAFSFLYGSQDTGIRGLNDQSNDD